MEELPLEILKLVMQSEPLPREILRDVCRSWRALVAKMPPTPPLLARLQGSGISLERLRGLVGLSLSTPVVSLVRKWGWQDGQQVWADEPVEHSKINTPISRELQAALAYSANFWRNRPEW